MKNTTDNTDTATEAYVHPSNPDPPSHHDAMAANGIGVPRHLFFLILY